MNDIERCLEQLKKSDIYAEVRNSKVLEIYGGKDISNIGGIKVFKDAFNICFERGIWIVRLPGEGQLINEYETANLEQAIEKVINFFG